MILCLWVRLSMTLIDTQVVWSVQTEEKTTLLLVNSPKSSLFQFYMNGSRPSFPSESDAVVNTLCAKVPKKISKSLNSYVCSIDISVPSRGDTVTSAYGSQSG